MQSALHRLPVLQTAEVRMMLNGPESFTPDGLFLLGEAAESRGLFLGCGMNSIGVATGGGAGMALAHCIVHGHTPIDLSEADPKRFPDCVNSVEALTARAPEVLGRHYEIGYPGRQWSTARNLRQSPFGARWKNAKAQFGQVYGWERPLYFGSDGDPALTFGKPPWFDQVGREVAQAHHHAALFDQSTFGKIRVEGADAERFLNRVCANDMTRAPGRAIYTAMLNDRGGFESDLTALRLSDEAYRLYVGTAAIKRDLAWLRNHLEAKERVRLFDETEDYAVLALMGPAASSIVRAVGADWIAALGYFRHAEDVIAGVPVRAVRLSYVGEAGWEMTCREPRMRCGSTTRCTKRVRARAASTRKPRCESKSATWQWVTTSMPMSRRSKPVSTLPSTGANRSLDATLSRAGATQESPPASRRSLSTTRVPCHWATSRSISVIESSARRRRPRLAIASRIRLRLPTSRLPTSAKSKACASKST